MTGGTSTSRTRDACYGATQHRRGGFTLPLALVVLVAVSMMAATALQMSLADFQANRGMRVSTRALFAAEAGSQRTLARWESGPYGSLTPGDSVSTGWVAMPDGSMYRSVVLRVDDGSRDEPLFRLLTEGRPSRETTARRRIVTVVEGGGAVGGELCCDAALSIDGRLRIDSEGQPSEGELGEDEEEDDDLPWWWWWLFGGGSGSSAWAVDGRDHTPMEWSGYCPTRLEPVAGIRIADDDDLDLGDDDVVEGDPPVQVDGSIGQDLVRSFGGTTYDALAAGADIVLSGSNERVDDVRPRARGGACDTSEEENWGAPDLPGSVCWDYLPVIHARGNLRLEDEGTGQGILLVDGDLDVRDEFRFYGLVVVQGSLDMRHESEITGGLLIGNRGSGGIRSRLRDEAVVDYSSCAVARAAPDFVGGGGGVAALAGRYWFEVD